MDDDSNDTSDTDAAITAPLGCDECTMGVELGDGLIRACAHCSHASRGHRWARAVLLFAVHTGVRMGEQRALRWTDVDFETRIITIRRSAPKWLASSSSATRTDRRSNLATTMATPAGFEPAFMP
jgi:hypothetical protein